MKDTSTSCMGLATLIATIMFSAAFTVPDGNNSDQGIPIFLQANSFMVFAVSDAIGTKYDLDFKIPNKSGQNFKTGEDIIEMYTQLGKDYPIVSIEELFDKDDWEHTKLFTSLRICQVVGDDLLMSNPKRIEKATGELICNALLLKTIHETHKENETLETIHKSARRKLEMVKTATTKDNKNIPDEEDEQRDLNVEPNFKMANRKTDEDKEDRNNIEYESAKEKDDNNNIEDGDGEAESENDAKAQS
ncbi:hypothetical protein GIB67_036715 [Kingdonia uniflora]|uniref:phosphopyruvate hydratase n=1 Tax=Kingdonia uniflora TaxID=39325 RepID=A0A7J7LWG5_9MAGN|nr:hypothetical protein GIB67_036715 [Kingdonia uniflora]